MNVSFLLHFYQPPDQQDDILNRIVNECYLPLTAGLLQLDNCFIHINMSGCLVDLLLEKGHEQVLINIKKLIEQNKASLTGTAKFHALLPLIPLAEINRQIDLNDDVMRRYFGNLYNPDGFFSPEMAFNDDLLEILGTRGYKWVALADTCLSASILNYSSTFIHKKSGLKLIPRHKRFSSLVLSGVCRTADDLFNECSDLESESNLYLAVMDAETFGHHRIGHEKFLLEVLQHPKFNTVNLSTQNNMQNTGATNTLIDSIRPSTWTNEEQDYWIDSGRTTSTLTNSFILWKDPNNPIHSKQWELLDLVINTVTTHKNSTDTWKTARISLDSALGSDQFWWASAKPWWSLEMIEQGAYKLKQVLINLNASMQSKQKAENLYQEILSLAFEWQRTGVIRKLHIKNSATYLKQPLKERAPSEWFNQLVLEFESEMNRACESREFEKAIKWRDALLKIKQGTDIYDILHVVDELWSARSLPSVKPFLSHSWDEISDFAKQFLLDVTTKDEFEAWKARRGFN